MLPPWNLPWNHFYKSRRGAVGSLVMVVLSQELIIVGAFYEISSGKDDWRVVVDEGRRGAPYGIMQYTTWPHMV